MANFHSHTFFWKNSRILALGRQMPRISGHDLCTKKPDIFGFPLLKLNPFLDCKNPRNQRFHIVGSPTQSLLSISHRSIQNVDPPFFQVYVPERFKRKEIENQLLERIRIFSYRFRISETFVLAWLLLSKSHFVLWAIKIHSTPNFPNYRFDWRISNFKINTYINKGASE